MDTVKGKPDWDSGKGTMANNKPIGGAGQPFGNIKKEVPDAKAAAIARRLKKKTDDKKKKSK